MSGYVFNNAAAAETAERFRSLAALLDPTTFRHLEALGSARPGARCLEVGGGGGTVARWLSERVGADGRVLVTDLDPRFLERSLRDAGNVEVREHDIVHDPLPSEGFEVVHARLVLEHIPEFGRALDRMVSALAPGGTLLVEEFDNQALSGIDSFGNPADVALYRKFATARTRVFENHGVHATIGRQLPALLRDRGLDRIGVEPYLTLWRGASAGGALEIANFGQMREEILREHLLTGEELAAGLRIFADPGWSRLSSLLFSAWGTKR